MVRESFAPHRPLAKSQDDVSDVHLIPTLDPELLQEDDTADELSEADLVETRASWKPGELQQENYLPPFNIPGFKGMEVTGTLRKYKARFDKADNPNQDNLIIDAKQGLIAVADELGGEGGRGASKRLEELLPKMLRKETLEVVGMDPSKLIDALTDIQQSKFAGSETYQEEIRKRMTTLVERFPELGEKALGLLRALTEINQEIQKTGAKTTFCGGIVHTFPNGERWVVAANIGDSAGYKQRPDGTLIPLFAGDSLLQLAVNTGALKPDQLEAMRAEPNKKFEIVVSKDIAIAMGATPTEAERLVLRDTKIPISYRKLQSTMYAALGGVRPVPSLAIRRFDPDDRLLLWTDGLDDFFPDEDGEPNEEKMAAALQGKTEAERLTNITNTAIKNGEAGVALNKDGDDIAAVSVRFEKI